MKRKYSYIFIFLSLLMIFSGFVGIQRKVFADYPIEIESKSAYLMEAETGKVIFSKEENTRLPIASMCKVMTLLLCFEKIEQNQLFLDENIMISENASGMGGSQVFLETSGEYKVEDLIKSIIVCSANDACVAMAERICGSEDMFVELMNERAEQLGMENTRFVNCTGLPKEGQYSCAKDVAKMFSELIKHEKYFDYSTIWMDEIHHPKDRITQISNTNKLIKFYSGCMGGKTGYTKEAGHCLTAVAQRDSTKIISVVIGAPDSKTRFNEVSSMFNYAFSNFNTKTIIDNTKPLNFTVEIKGGKKDSVLVYAEKSIKFFSEKGEKRSFEVIFNKKDNLKAPIKKDECVGTLDIFEKGVLLKSVNVLSNESVEKQSYYDNLNNLIKNWSIA